MRPSDLESFKSRLVEMRSRLTSQVQDIEDAIRETVVPAGEVSTVHTHPADIGADGLDTHIVLAQNEEGLLEQVEAALRRIEEGTFGICQRCRQPIEPERLEAVPYSPYCIQCAERMQAEGEYRPGVDEHPFQPGAS